MTLRRPFPTPKTHVQRFGPFGRRIAGAATAAENERTKHGLKLMVSTRGEMIVATKFDPTCLG